MTSPMPANDPVEEGTTYWQHGWEKCKKNPLVPIGAVATTAALLGATASLRSGNRASFQKYLRLRVAAQGLTVVAMLMGAYYLTEKAEDARPPHLDAPRFIPSRAVEENDQAEFYPPRGKVRVSDFTRRIRESDEKKL